MAKGRKKAVGIGLGICLVAGGGYAAANFWRSPPAVAPDFTYPLKGELRSWEEHDRLYAEARGDYSVRLPVGDGEIYLMGVHHTSSPEAEIIGHIESEMRQFKPDVALVEGRMGFFIGGRKGGIRTFGESGLVYSLAKEMSVPCLSFEPDRAAEAAYIVDQGFSKEAVGFTLFFRSYLGDRGSGAIPDSEAQRLLSKRLRQHQLEGAVKDLADADRIWKEVLKMPGDWRSAPKDTFTPGSANMLQRIASAANRVRDDYLVRALIDEARAGRRVFCTVGMSHAIRCEPVLTATAGTPAAAAIE